MAKNSKRIKPGYFNPLTDRPIFVPGFNWLQILVTGMQGVPVLTHLCYGRRVGKTGIIAAPIHLPNDERQLLLVASHLEVGHKPWFLITTKPAHSAEQARQIECPCASPKLNWRLILPICILRRRVSNFIDRRPCICFLSLFIGSF